MRKVLIDELEKPSIDIEKLGSLIENGNPRKLFGFIYLGTKPIGLFDIYKGQNIFHYLADKGLLSMVLPTFFGSKSKDILSREKSSLPQLEECINSVNLSKLTPAHIAVIHNPTALQTLSKVGAILTSKAYAAILQKNDDGALDYSPLEYIFKDEPTAHNFFTKSIRAGCVDIFALLSKEEWVVQVKFLKYLPYVVQEVKKINTASSNNVFSVVFQDYWRAILAADSTDSSSYKKTMRLIDILNDQKKNFDLSIEDWSHLLSIENFQNFSQISRHILHKCADKFLDGSLSAMELEDFIKVDAIEDGKFQQLKHYFINGDLNSSGPVEVKSDGAISTNPAEHRVPLIDNRVLNTKDSTGSVNLEERHSVDHSVKEHKERESDRVEPQKRASAIPTTSFSPITEPASSPSIKPKAVEKVVSIHEYAELVTSYIKQILKCSEYLKNYLGESYTQLHSFIAILALSDNYFERVLQAIAAGHKLVPKNTSDFLSEYIEKLEVDDFLVATNNENQFRAYDLACVLGQVDLAKLLLTKSLELGVYSESTNDIFLVPIKYDSIGVIQYLLNEQSNIIIDWHYILSQAIRYSNIKAVECYINSESDIIQDITDRSGLSKGQKYNILNRALYNLTQLSMLTYLQNDQQNKETALKEIPKLCQCIKMMVESNKVYYAEENLLVLKKTFFLLKELQNAFQILLQDQSMSKIAEEISHVKDLIISHYESSDLFRGQKLLEKINDDADYDTVSNTSGVSHFSVFSDLRRKGQFDDKYKEAVMTSGVSHVKPLSSVIIVNDPLVEDRLSLVLGESADYM